MFLEACVIVRNFVAWIDDERRSLRTQTYLETKERVNQVNGTMSALYRQVTIVTYIEVTSMLPYFTFFAVSGIQRKEGAKVTLRIHNAQ